MGFEKGGLEELRPSKNLSFWPVMATKVAVTGQKIGSTRGTQRVPGPSHSLLFK
jgi:hypothetical protein